MESTVTAGISAPVIMALIQIAKPYINNDRVYAPLALALGIVLNLAIAVARGADPLDAGLSGLLAGLAASGLYSGGRAVAGA